MGAGLHSTVDECMAFCCKQDHSNAQGIKHWFVPTSGFFDRFLPLHSQEWLFAGVMGRRRPGLTGQ
jgi:hypothetical protein